VSKWELVGIVNVDVKYTGSILGGWCESEDVDVVLFFGEGDIQSLGNCCIIRKLACSCGGVEGRVLHDWRGERGGGESYSMLDLG